MIGIVALSAVWAAIAVLLNMKTEPRQRRDDAMRRVSRWTGGLVITLLATASASASDPLYMCGSPSTGVYDEGQYLTGGMVQVLNSIQKVKDNGADVRVMAISQLAAGHSTLDEEYKFYLGVCREWQFHGDPRTAKNNLLVVLVAVGSRKTGIFFGSQWRPALSDEWPHIQANVMNPKFKAKDYAGGVSAGLDEVARAIAYKPAIVLPPGKTDQSSGDEAPWVLVLILGILAGLGGLTLIVYKILNSKEEKERLEGIRKVVTSYSGSDYGSRAFGRKKEAEKEKAGPVTLPPIPPTTASGVYTQPPTIYRHGHTVYEDRVVPYFMPTNPVFLIQDNGITAPEPVRSYTPNPTPPEPEPSRRKSDDHGSSSPDSWSSGGSTDFTAAVDSVSVDSAPDGGSTDW